MSNLLLATDFSPAADAALIQALELAVALRCDLEIFHVHPVSVTPVVPALELASIPPSAKEIAEGEMQLAERVAQAKAAGVACEGQTAFGSAPEEVATRAAATRPRFIVVGTHGHSPVRRALLGSVAERIVERAPCPVLVVPSR